MSVQQNKTQNKDKDLFWVCENSHEWTLIEENQECPVCGKY